MTTDRSRHGRYSVTPAVTTPVTPVTPAVLLVVLASLVACVLLAGSGAPRSFGSALSGVHVTAAGAGQGGISSWLPRSQQPDRAGWNDVPAAVLAAGVVFAAGVTGVARQRQLRLAVSSAFFPSSPRAPPARVSTS